MNSREEERESHLKAVGVRKIQLPRGVHDATPVPQVAQGSTLRHAVAVEACWTKTVLSTWMDIENALQQESVLFPVTSV